MSDQRSLKKVVPLNTSFFFRLNLEHEIPNCYFFVQLCRVVLTILYLPESNK